jgi:hypothetical protein
MSHLALMLNSKNFKNLCLIFECSFGLIIIIIRLKPNQIIKKVQIKTVVHFMYISFSLCFKRQSYPIAKKLETKSL